MTAGGTDSIDEQLKQTEEMIRDGAGIIDIGAVSTRPAQMRYAR